MKIKNIFLTTIVLALTLFSCVDDKEYTYDGGNNSDVVRFNSTVAGQSPMVRAANSAWDAGDAIGVYMKTGAGLSGVIDGAANKKHTTTGNGNFVAANIATDAIFFPASGQVDFIAYYPYAATLASDVYKVDVTSQSSQEAIDLLYSNDATGKASGDAVTLGFKHELTKVVFTLIAANSTVDLTGAKVEIEAMNTKADFDLATGVLTSEATTAKIAMKTTLEAGSTTKGIAEGVVIPTVAAARKFLFTFKDGGVTYTKEWDASAEPFEKGKKNTYPVQIGGDKGILVNPGSTIEDWGPGSSENIVIDLDGDGGETTVGSGTLADPFTVEDAAIKVDEVSTWVTGYILGSSPKTKSLGGASKDNIVLATVAGEKDEAKWIIVDLVGSAVQNKLDIVADATLIGKKVKVQGNIVKNIFGGALAMTVIVAQEGGSETTPPVGEEKEYFFENVAPDDAIYGGSGNPPRPTVNVHTAWKMGSPITYSSTNTKADIRTTSSMNASIWIAGNAPATLTIANIDASYKSIKLSYDLCAGALTVGQTTNATEIKVKANGSYVTVPSVAISEQNIYSTVEISLPDGVHTLEFETASAVGFRLDNIKLKGTK